MPVFSRLFGSSYPGVEPAANLYTTLIWRRNDKMMQNRGGANRTHAEAWNSPDRRDRNDSHRGIFPRAPQAVPRAWLARPRRADLRGVPDVSWHRTGRDLFQPDGLDVVHLDCRCRGVCNLRPFAAARGAARPDEDGRALGSFVADF